MAFLPPSLLTWYRTVKAFWYDTACKEIVLQNRLFLLIFWIGLIVCPFTWAADTIQATEPSPTFPETSFRFDPVVEGSEVIHDFMVKNPGTAPLEISAVRTG